MQVSSRFTIAVHILTAVNHFQDEVKCTSDFLASSIQVNPVVVRRVLQQLKKAEVIKVARGTGGATLGRPLEEITFYDIFYAVDSIEDGKLFHFHENPNVLCPVGRNIHAGLDDKLDAVQKAMEDKMKELTMADVVRDMEASLACESGK